MATGTFLLLHHGLLMAAHAAAVRGLRVHGVGQLHEVAVLVAVDGVADGTGLDADMMAGAAAVHGSLMRLVVEHHGLHAGFGSAHGALGVVDGQQHGGVGLTTHQAGNRVHLLELGLGLFGMATGAGGGAGHNRGLNGGGFGGGGGGGGFSGGGGSFGGGSFGGMGGGGSHGGGGGRGR